MNSNEWKQHQRKLFWSDVLRILFTAAAALAGLLLVAVVYWILS